VAAVVLIVLASSFLVVPIINNWINDEYALQGLKTINAENAQRLSEALNTTKWLAANTLEDKDAQRQLAMNFYANGTISWEQLQFLLQQIDSSYNPLINNCTMNIAAMLGVYYNTTAGLYDEYMNGLASFSSWTNWIWDIIYLIAALVVAYIVIVLVSKFKSVQAPSQSVIIPYKI
jgi:hypothetical protein